MSPFKKRTLLWLYKYCSLQSQEMCQEFYFLLYSSNVKSQMLLKGKAPSIQVKEKLLLSSTLPTVQSRWYLSVFHIWITTCLWSFFFFVAFFYCLLFPIEKRNTAHLPITLVVFQLLVHSEHFLESIPVSVLEILFLELTTSSSNLDWVLLRPTHSRLSGSSFL